jgi:ATP-dependent DNA helicase RecG
MNLKDSVTALPRVGDTYATLLKNLDIYTIEDLLNHIPYRYLDTRNLEKLSDSLDDESHFVEVRITKIVVRRLRGYKRLIITYVTDGSLTAQILWFNQEYLLKVFKEGDTYLMYGKLKLEARTYFFSPSLFELKTGNNKLGNIIPIYHLTKGISQKFLRGRIEDVLKMGRSFIPEYIPEETLKSEKLIGIYDMYRNIHYPETPEALVLAQERFKFNEMLGVVNKLKEKRKKFDKFKAREIDISKHKYDLKFNFELSSDQKTSLSEILMDLSSSKPMNRLLMGDVGSGKTIVAFLASSVVLSNGYDVILLAPTTILASQHFHNAKKVFEDTGVEVVLVTSKSKLKESSGNRLIITTHAILHREKEILKNVGLIIIDEQHKFGVEQREQIFKESKGLKPHILTMSATPIPRTVAELYFGDVKVSTIKTKPRGRIDIRTLLVTDEKRESGYRWIREKLLLKEQMYVVCPAIEESEEFKSVKIEYEKIKEIYKEFKVEMLHGKFKEEKKNEITRDFRDRKIDILVSTQLIEVGMDNPNATLMLIESAEKFGLAQLHQLRGRVGRGEKESYCLIMGSLNERLKYFATHNDGFKLSEYDLKLRGPGEVFGTLQSGMPGFKLANILDIDLFKRCSKVLIKKKKE